MKLDKGILIGSFFSLLIVVLSKVWDSDYRKKMKNTYETKGFFVNNTNVRYAGSTSYYNYYAGHKKYEGSFFDEKKFLKEGDTIMIRYSVEDSSLSEIVDIHYMQKYKHLKSTND